MLPRAWTAGPKRDPEAHRARGIVFAVATFLGITLLAWGGFLLPSHSSGVVRFLRRNSPSPSPSAALAPSPTTSPVGRTPSPTPSVEAEVVGSFPGAAHGARLNIWVDRLATNNDCYTDAFPDVLAGYGAYYSDCKSWKDSGIDAYFFYLVAQNLTAEDVNFSLDGLEISSRQGRTLRPLRLLALQSDPTLYIPFDVTLTSRQELKGYIAFDALINFVPDRLTYTDGEQSLVIEFHGRHTRLKPT